jgi:hypothetical protein
MRDPRPWGNKKPWLDRFLRDNGPGVTYRVQYGSECGPRAGHYYVVTIERYRGDKLEDAVTRGDAHRDGRLPKYICEYLNLLSKYNTGCGHHTAGIPYLPERTFKQLTLWELEVIEPWGERHVVKYDTPEQLEKFLNEWEERRSSTVETNDEN